MNSKMFINFLKTLPQISVDASFRENFLYVRITDTNRQVKRTYKANLDICKDSYGEDLIGEIFEDCAENFCMEVYNI